MKKILSILLILVLSISVFAGCGKTEDKAAEKEVEKTEEVAEKEVVAQEETVEAEEELGWPRTITDARGVEVTFEKKPERIATVAFRLVEFLMALDNPPIASSNLEYLDEYEILKEYLKKYKIEDLGSPGDLEMLAGLKPDLILTSPWNRESYETLEQIAPIFEVDGGVEMNDIVLDMISKIIGREKEAEELLENQKTYMAEARKNLSNVDESVGFLTGNSDQLYAIGLSQNIEFYDNENGLGLISPEGWPEKFSDISLEALSEIDPDVLFIGAEDFDVFMSEINQNSVWKAMKVVKNGRVFPLDPSGGPISNKYAAEKIIEALLK